jgi:hypothetical protein
MLRFGLVVLIALMVVPQLAKAHCGDCPFPMAKLFGSWQSDVEGNFTVIITQDFANYDEVGVKVVIWDGVNHRVVAVGYGKGEPTATNVRADVRFENGKHTTYNLSVDRLGKGLIMDRGSANLNDRSCEPDNGCFYLRPVFDAPYNKYLAPMNWT